MSKFVQVSVSPGVGNRHGLLSTFHYIVSAIDENGRAWAFESNKKRWSKLPDHPDIEKVEKVIASST